MSLFKTSAIYFSMINIYNFSIGLIDSLINRKFLFNWTVTVGFSISITCQWSNSNISFIQYESRQVGAFKFIHFLISNQAYPAYIPVFMLLYYSLFSMHPRPSNVPIKLLREWGPAKFCRGRFPTDSFSILLWNDRTRAPDFKLNWT